MINDVYLSLGSNQGDRIFNLDRALNVLRLLSSSKIRVSGLYETSAQGFRTQPHFINMSLFVVNHRYEWLGVKK